MRKITWNGMLSAWAMTLFLGACEKELPDSKLRGKDVLVEVRMLGVEEGGEKDVTRSSSRREIEESVVPVGDGVLLEMRMERDSSMLRAARTTLAGTSRFRVVAVVHGTSTFISYADFTINNGTVAGGLHVPDNGVYDFICYSYNTASTLPGLSYKQDATIPTSATINVYQGTSDLLFEKIENISVSGAAPVLGILLRRVMARVKVVINCEYNGWAIESVANTMTLGSAYSGGTIRLTDGVAVPTGTPAITWPTLSGTNQEEESNQVLVMPQAGGVTVRIPGGTIKRQGLAAAIPTGTESYVLSAPFSTPVESGYSYRLFIKLKTPIFARSNIYWDGTAQKLTFIPAAANPASNDDTKKGLQGVFFKFGSLVGISPAQTSGSDNFSGNTPIYVPVVKNPLNTSTWKPTTGNAMANDNTFPGVTSNWTSWGDNTYGDNVIPYMDMSHNWEGFMNPEWNTLSAYQGFRGDICQYLCKTGAVTGDYRTPTGGEFGGTHRPMYDDLHGWHPVNNYTFPEVNTAGYADGTADLPDATPGKNGASTAFFSIYNSTMWNVAFPASGQRSYVGELQYVGFNCTYWVGDYVNLGMGHSMTFWATGSAIDSPLMNAYRSEGLPVRCVKK
jgi:hypothetical protein